MVSGKSDLFNPSSSATLITCFVLMRDCGQPVGGELTWVQSTSHVLVTIYLGRAVEAKAVIEGGGTKDREQ